MVGGFPHVMLFGMAGLAGRESRMIGVHLFFLGKHISEEPGCQNTDNTARYEISVPFVAFMHFGMFPGP